MTGVALKGLAGRKIRALLTAFAIVIGVSMVSGTFILTDTMQKSFTGLFDASYAKTDAVIQGKEIVENSTNGSGVTLPASLLDEVRALPEVEAAGGIVMPEESHSADIIGKDGKAVAQEGIGTSYDAANARFSPLNLKTGAWPEGDGQVVIDAGTAEQEQLSAGDAVVVDTAIGEQRYEITGTASYGEVDSLGFGSIAVWDLETAQHVLGRDGRFDGISIAAKDGTSAAALVKAVEPLVPANVVVQDSDEQAEEDAQSVNDSMGQIRLFLLGFGGIALLVGAFVIFNTLSITVAQRTREFATLRTLGASRKQVMRSVRLEGLVIGLLGSVIGLVAGLGISEGMIALFSALGVDLPEGATVVAERTVIVSLLLGTGITLLASILPARRATRVPPIAAVREGAELPPTRMAARSHHAGLGVTLASLAAISLGIFAGGVSGAAVGLLLGGGVLGLFFGIALLAPRLVKPLARVIGLPARRAGGAAGELAGANAVRNPGRTASTAAALMIGLTLVTVVAVLGAGINHATKAAITEQVHDADYIVDGKQGLPFSAAEGDAIAATPGVQQVSHVRSDTALVQGEQLEVSGIDPATIADFYTFAWTTGSDRTLDRLGPDGALVSKQYAADEHLKVGSPLSVTTPSGERRTLVVSGVYDPPEQNALLGDVSMTRAAFDEAFENPKNSFTFIAAGAEAGTAIEAATEGSGSALFHTGAEYPQDATKDMATVMAMLYVLLGFSVIVSLFGMVNTMVLSVFERTREIGMLRTIGMTRRQARRMIRQESVITALIGTTLGVGLGLLLAGLVIKAVAMDGLAFVVPVAPLAAFTLVAVAAGIGAAVLPARRASRLNVLDALKYE
jgi:putative ABC transport system permease protein